LASITAEQADTLSSAAVLALTQVCHVCPSCAAATSGFASAKVAPSIEVARQAEIGIFPMPPDAILVWSPVCIAGFTRLNDQPESFFGRFEGMTTGSVRDNKALRRFELDVEGAVAFANYRLAPGAVIITHTETPRALRGRGIASELVQGALQLIRADGSKVVAGCGFVVDYLQTHPEFADLVGR
jgi:predicted GNAT family acetyltransferase